MTPPTSGPSLCIAMPAYNEEASIEHVVRESLEVLDRWPGGGEVLVINDGSADGTAGILARLAAADPRLRVVHQAHQGLAAAIETTKREAGCDYCFLTGADDQWSSWTALAMLPHVLDGADVVVGRRRRKPGYSLYRRFVSGAYNRLSRILFGVPTHDAGSQRLLRTRLLRDIPRTSRSPYADAEFLIRCQYLGYRLAIVDIDGRPRSSGVARGARPALVWAALTDMLRLLARRRRLASEGVPCEHTPPTERGATARFRRP